MLGDKKAQGRGDELGYSFKCSGTNSKSVVIVRGENKNDTKADKAVSKEEFLLLMCLFVCLLSQCNGEAGGRPLGGNPSPSPVIPVCELGYTKHLSSCFKSGINQKIPRLVGEEKDLSWYLGQTFPVLP